MKKILLIIICMLALLFVCSCSGNTAKQGTVYAQITMEDGGVITLQLDGDTAPITVANFVKLANAGTYDGTIFHRVIKDFMIQGGDPTGTGYGDSSIPKIKGEFSANGVKNNISHVRGVISMARSGNSMDSASSQFFICHADSTYLDGQYAAFGRVISGMDVVDKIANVGTNANDRPIQEQKMKSVRIVDEAAAKSPVTESDTTDTADTTPTLLSGTHYAQITMEDGGVITLELYADIAPITVTNFAKHVKKGTYDGLIFHRVIEDFMIQGGDPTGTGYGDSSIPAIKGEFSANGVKNDIDHVRGVISMARTSDNTNSATTQFFIVHADSPHLNGQYAAFGRVIAGMGVVDKIANVGTNANDRPIQEQKMKEIRMIDKATADAAVKAEADTAVTDNAATDTTVTDTATTD